MFGHATESISASARQGRAAIKAGGPQTNAVVAQALSLHYLNVWLSFPLSVFQPSRHCLWPMFILPAGSLGMPPRLFRCGLLWHFSPLVSPPFRERSSGSEPRLRFPRANVPGREPLSFALARPATIADFGVRERQTEKVCTRHWREDSRSFE